MVDGSLRTLAWLVIVRRKVGLTPVLIKLYDGLVDWQAGRHSAICEQRLGRARVLEAGLSHDLVNPVDALDATI